ncbi:MAG: hypothetical protein IJ833_07190 [Lachnospiraceae bacterium]|nr:hypothetical protein [Lachnospiraceae bacterium]
MAMVPIIRLITFLEEWNTLNTYKELYDGTNLGLSLKSAVGYLLAGTALFLLSLILLEIHRTGKPLTVL